MSRRSLALRASASAALLALAGIASADVPSIATPTGAVQVLRITPSGQVESAQRQVVIQFDRPMIVLGAAPPRLDSVPVTITPALDCNWHWVNTSTLACELAEHGSKPHTPGYNRFGYQVEQGGFAPATAYIVKVQSGIKATDGNVLEKDVTEEFNTERPRAQYGYLREWSGPTEPVIQVTFNLPVTRSSVEAHLFFPTTAGRVPVSAMADPDDRRDFYVLPASGGAPVHVDGQVSGAPQNDDEDDGGDEDEDGAPTPGPAASTAAAPATTVPAGEQARYQWLVAVRSGAKLPGDEAVNLLQEPGLVTPLGPERGDHDSEVGRGIVTYGEPHFLGVTCGEDNDLFLDDPAKPGATGPSCDPQRYVIMAFSVPVKKEELEAHFTAKVGGKSVDPIGDIPDAQRWGYERYEDNHFNVFFETPLKSDSDYTVQMTAGMKDVWGRPMQEGGSAGFHTTHRQPSLELREQTAVLEKGVDSDVPLYFTNLDKLSANFSRLSIAGSGADKVDSTTFDYKLPDVHDLSVGMPLDVRGLLGGRSGVVSGTLVPTPEPERRYYGGYDPYHFFAQVTPFHVVVKLGHFDTLVWVTDLATGQPVAGARVRIFPADPEDFANQSKDVVSTTTDPNGMALLPGGVTLDPDLTLRQPHYGQDRARVLVVKVDRGGDMALLPLDYTFQVDTYSASHYQVQQRLRKQFGHMHAWGTTAEGIYRAGDTIQYKIFVRDQDNHHFIPPPDVQYTVTLEDPLGNIVDKHEDVKLSPFGTFSGEYKVPETAPVGWYQFHLGFADDPDAEKAARPSALHQLRHRRTGSGVLDAMRVLVSDFTPAPFHVDTSLNGVSFQPGDQVQVTTTARLHSGGPYTGTQGRATVSLKAEDFRPASPALAGFTFASYDAQLNQRDQTVNETESAVDGQGVLKTGFQLQDAGIYYGKLLVEGDVRDERGKYIAAVTRADYLGRDRFVGLRMNQWMLNAQQAASVQYVVVDGAGKPMVGTEVDIAVERMDLKASRVKGPGDAYLTQYSRDWAAAGGCKATSTAQPAACQFTPPQPGSYRIRATIKDSHGREHQSSLPVWVIGKGMVLWENHDDGALTIIPEKTEYHVGDRARYLIQNPYPGAKALISIERYGVLKCWVQTLEGSAPVIDFPVEQDYVPGFYLSVTVVSPRVAKPLGKDQVDLGKPAFMSGYLNVPVVDDYKALDIKVTTPKDTYKPRDTVNVDIDVKARHGDAGKVELAAVVLDDSVFDLLSEGKDYFDPYKGFYSLDGLDLQTYDLILRLVGRQSFEKKGATPGGDGGAAVSLRSLFKFVSYWNPTLEADARGHAKFSFQVPDNLTGWRVLVVAVNQGDRMGLGQGTFKVNQPTELRPVMPNQVTQGDSFTAGFSVMNRTDKPRDIKVHITAKGSVQGTPAHDETVHVDPYQRATVWLPVQSTSPGSIDFAATAGDAADSDGLKQSVPVQRAVTLVDLAQYGTSTGAVIEPVQYPSGALPGSVTLGVNLTPTVIGNLKGAFDYMQYYPYLCWEQRLTKAVMAANFKRLHAYLGKDVSWPGSDGIPGEALADAAQFQAPNGGMAYWVAEDRYTDPYLSAYTALAFNWLRAQGYTPPAAVEQRLHEYLKGFLQGDSVPDWYGLGMRSSVRAVILAVFAEDKEATLDDLRRFEPSLKDMDLFGKSWFMQASLDLKAQDLADEDLKMILNQSNETGGKFEFSEVLDDGYNRILSTPMRSNCTALSALSRYAQGSETYAAAVADVPFKLVRSITAIRGDRDHWENTQENLFCMQALADYSEAYEKTAPAMHVAVSAGADAVGTADFHSVQDPAVQLSKPLPDSLSGAKPMPVAITSTGAGRLYYKVGLSYAPSVLPDSVNDGLGLHREYSVERDGKWLLLKSPMQVARGELVRVDLYVEVPAAREFVAVYDPVPGGLEPVDRNLATSSERDAKAGDFQAAGGAYWFNFDDWEDFGVQFWDFYHQELRHDSARFFADYLPAGHYHLSYSAQAVASGSFLVQAPKVEEMYDPDVFGLDSSAQLEVRDPAPAPAPAAGTH
ncbi:MAG TPA: alpha-2-macroglobulin family protein [Gammaproteobacteria bacterium]|jgi:hypothetical protein